MARILRTLSLACLAVLAVAANASAAQRRVAVGDAALIPHGASLTNAVRPHARMRVTLSLTSRNPIAMHTLALAVATPGNPQYGHTLTVSQFAERFGAPRSTLTTVRRALSRDGLQIVRTYANHLSITASGSAATIERTFDTGLTHVRLAGGRRTMVNTTAPTLPAAIAPDVDAVFGLDGLANPTPAGLSRRHRGSPAAAGHPVTHARRRAATPDIVTGGPQPCAAATAAAAPLPVTEASEPFFGYTADGLAAAYGLPALYAQGDAGQGQTILLYEQESLDPNDVAAFQACYGTAARVSIVPVDTPDPVDHGSNGDGEAALDVDQIIGLAPQASIVVYEASQNDLDGSGELLSAIASNHTGKIVSISYGTCEALTGASVAGAEAKLFDEMALQGQSVFAASGDSGAQGCQRDDGSQKLGVSDPASQPTVTGVGGTSLYSGTSQSPVPYDGSNPLIEGVWNSTAADTAGNVDQAASGGGDSKLWKMPSFQSSAAAGLGVVNGYSGSGACGSSRCREVPDVSAAGDPDTGAVIYANLSPNGGAPGSQWTTFGGTSAAAPLWAAFTALTNVLPTCRGLSVGDINPALYGLAGANYAGYFRDVNAPSAFTSLTTNWTDLVAAPTGAFPVGAGYDLATGLGAPLVDALAPALCATRAPVYTVTVGSPGHKKFDLHRKVKFKVPGDDSGGAALRFNATGLPPGLKIHTSTGVITGKVRKLGRYAVTVGAEDFATNQGTTQFTIAVVVPKAHFATPSLHGLAARMAKLRFVVSTPAHRRLRSVTIHLPKRAGLSFTRSNRRIFVHADTGKRHGRVRVKTRRHPRALTLRFRKPQKKVIVVIGRATLKTSRKLARRARTHSFRVRIGLSATDTQHHTSHHSARVKVRKAKRHHMRHHHTKHHSKKHHHK